MLKFSKKFIHYKFFNYYIYDCISFTKKNVNNIQNGCLSVKTKNINLLDINANI